MRLYNFRVGDIVEIGAVDPKVYVVSLVNGDSIYLLDLIGQTYVFDGETQTQSFRGRVALRRKSECRRSISDSWSALESSDSSTGEFGGRELPKKNLISEGSR